MRLVVGAAIFVDGTLNALEVGAEKLRPPAGGAANVVPPSPPKPPRPKELEAVEEACPKVGSVGAVAAVVERFIRGVTVPVGLAKDPNPPKPADVVGVANDEAADTTGAANVVPNPLNPPPPVG